MSENPITAISRAVAEHQDLKEALQATYENLDPQALADTLQGETNLEEALERVAEKVKEYEALSAAIKIRLDDLQARKSRTDKAAKTLRALILQAMDTANLKNAGGTYATLTATQGKPQIVVDDESELPSECFEPQPPKLSKERLKEAFTGWTERQARALEEDPKADVTPFPGAHLSNGSLSLTIRVK